MSVLHITPMALGARLKCFFFFSYFVYVFGGVLPNWLID